MTDTPRTDAAWDLGVAPTDLAAAMVHFSECQKRQQELSRSLERECSTLAGLIHRLSNGPEPDGRLCWCSEYKQDTFRAKHAKFCDEALAVVRAERERRETLR